MEEKQVPEFFKEMLYKQYDESTVQLILKGYNLKRKTTLRVNTLKTNREKIEEELRRNNIEFSKVLWNENALIIENATEKEIKELSFYKTGEIYLQSLSSMLPVIFLKPLPKENILDMCAAPGGKATQIAALADNKVMLTACEKNKIRLDRLKYNIEKQGVKCINIMREDSRFLSDYFSFDKILLDSPCSGSGTLGIFGKDFSIDLINRSVKFQEELLRKAIKILKPEGEMIYSTCSILENENETILKKFKNEIEIVPLELENFKTLPKLPTKISGTLCVLPNGFYEGFFVAKLKKIL